MRPLLVVGALLLSATALADDPGKSVYDAKCVACHGASGKGDGPAALALEKPPPDFTTADFWKGLSDDHIRTILTSGTPGGTMRAFPIKPEQMDALLVYLRTFQPK